MSYQLVASAPQSVVIDRRPAGDANIINGHISGLRNVIAGCIPTKLVGWGWRRLGGLRLDCTTLGATVEASPTRRTTQPPRLHVQTKTQHGYSAMSGAPAEKITSQMDGDSMLQWRGRHHQRPGLHPKAHNQGPQSRQNFRRWGGGDNKNTSTSNITAILDPKPSRCASSSCPDKKFRPYAAADLIRLSATRLALAIGIEVTNADCLPWDLTAITHIKQQQQQAERALSPHVYSSFSSILASPQHHHVLLGILFFRRAPDKP